MCSQRKLTRKGEARCRQQAIVLNGTIRASSRQRKRRLDLTLGRVVLIIVAHQRKNCTFLKGDGLFYSHRRELGLRTWTGVTSACIFQHRSSLIKFYTSRIEPNKRIKKKNTLEGKSKAGCS